MAENTLSFTIFVNNDNNRIYFYQSDGDSNGSFTAAPYHATAMDDGFFDELSQILRLYKQKHTAKSLPDVSLLLPDDFFLTDMITIPNMGKKAVNNSLNLVIGTVYQNKSDLTYNTFLLSQNKQTAQYGLVGIRTALLERFEAVFDDAGYRLENVTFVSNAMADGAMALNPKLRGETCLLLDMKDTSAHFAFLNKGRTLGSYRLPFGRTVLHPSQLAAEDLLFDHSSAELLVLNAKQKAKAKQHTMMGDLDLADSDDETPYLTNELTDAFDGEPEEEDEPMVTRGGRKLPKFMLRETPTDQKGFIYENFRIFMKWTLDLIASNPKITALGEIETVYVNMPQEYHFLFDMVNEEEEENGVIFAPMFSGAAPKVLELLGGCYVKQYNKLNNF